MTTTDKKILAGRVALVTGASRGIGAASAKALAAAGAHVILLARTQGGLEETDDAIQSAGGTATLMPFDLAETRKIPAIGPAIAERFSRLDMFVGNAGILGSLSPVALSDAKNVEEVFRINVTANCQMIRALDPLLRGSDAGRAVFVTASEASGAAPFWGPYAASKAALEAFIRTYAAEVAHSKVKVNLVDPGPVATKLRREAFPAEDQMALQTPDDAAARILSLLTPDVQESGKTFRAAA